MSLRFKAAWLFAGLLAACSETPQEPVAMNTTSYPSTAVAQPATWGALASAPAIGPRVEIYAGGVLRQVLSADAAAGAFAAGSEMLRSDISAETLERLARNPVNKRTAHFARLLQAVVSTPAAHQVSAMRALSRQLLRETQHRDTTLADGTRILEYYFDGELATRVVLAPRPSLTLDGSPAGSPPTPFGAATEIPGESCTEGCANNAEYESTLDAELWATLTWYADQLQAMVDEANAQTVDYETDAGTVESGLVLIVYQKKCIAEIAAWITSVGGTGFAIGKLAEGWGLLSLIEKQGGVMSVATGFNAAVNAWIAMHNCFHP